MGDNSVNNSLNQSPINWAVSSSLVGSYGNGTVAGHVPHAKSANPESLALSLLSQMHDVTANGHVPTTGVAGTAGVQNTHPHSGARFSGQSFTSTMPPPAAPQVKFDGQTQAAFQSFSAETKAALQNVQTWTQQQPSMQQPATQSLISPNSKTVDQTADDVSKWFTGTGTGAAEFANGGLSAFMKLRLQNTDKAINSLQQLAASSADLQGDMAEQQAAAALAQEKEAQKAHKKSGLLGIFQKIFTVIIAIVTVVVAFLTMQPELAGLAIAAAAIAFVAAGAAKGKGGFDFWGGMEWFNNIAGIAGLSAIIKSAAEAGIACAVKSTEAAVAKGVTEGAGDAAQGVAKSADGVQMTEKTSQEAAEVAESGKGAAAGAESGTTSLTKMANESKADFAARVAEQENKKLIQKIADAKNGKFGKFKQFKAHMGANLLKNTGFQTMTEYTNRMWVAGGIMTGVTVGDQVGSAAMQYQVSMHQANANEHGAEYQQLKAMVKLLDSSYKTANDLVQTLIKSHSNAVDVAQSVLKSGNEVRNLISTNMSQI